MSEQSSNSAIVVATPKQPTRILLVQQNAILELKQKFKRDVHYGPPYPGSKKDTLLKPGAELLARRFGLYPHYEAVKEILQINPSNLSESVIVYIYRCQMIDIASGVIVGEAIGACSSLEDKYRQRTAKRTCPTCNQGAIYRSKYPESLPEEQRGWYCKDCNAKFTSNAPEILNQVLGVIVNPNPMNELNTIIKISQKRSFVSSVIVATGASSYFAPGDAEVQDVYLSADVDDKDVVDTTWEDITDVPDSFPDDQAAGQGAPPQIENAKLWLNEKDIHYLVSRALGTFDGITVQDIVRYVGFTDLKDLTDKGWGKFADAKAAGLAIKEGAEKDAEAAKNAPPATPKGNKWTMPALKNAVLKDVYNGNAFHMDKSISKLVQTGKLPPVLTLEQLIEVVKTRKDEKPPADSSDEAFDNIGKDIPNEAPLSPELVDEYEIGSPHLSEGDIPF